jgi:hypothetical protein
MSTLPTPGWLIGEMSEDHSLTKRGYSQHTNDKLAGDNASPMPGCADIAATGFKAPQNVREVEPNEGVGLRAAMADQGDQECKLSLTRR